MLTNLPPSIDRQKFLNEPLNQFLTGVVLLSSWVASPAVASPIAPASDGTGTTVTQDGNQFNINGGQLSGDGANLFHSFEQFGLDVNQVANFESNPAIQNILGKVVGGNASIINGLIQVTGGSSNLFLMNPAGMVFGANAQLNVPADFTATTSTGIGFSNGNSFQAIGEATWAELVGNPSNFEFGLSQPGIVANFGNLEVPSGQNLSLFGGQVFNAGSLSSSGGNITIASVPGETVLHISQPGHLLSLEITPIAPNSENLGNQPAFDPLLLPDLLTGGQNINHANKIEQNSDGTILLTGSGISINPNYSALTVVSDYLNVSGETGGNVQVFGDKVALIGTTVNADGTMGGGNIFVGGELQGQGTYPPASITFVSDDSAISANGLDQGNGGQVIVWSDQINRFNGNVTATGGVNGGNGGFVEISAQQNLRFRGTVDVNAPEGTFGSILMDPKNITIADGGTDTLDDNDIFSENITNDVTFDGDNIAGLNGEVILEANNDITVNEDIVSDSVDHLELRAGRSIHVNANIETSASNGNIILKGNDESKGDTTERDLGAANIQMAEGTSLNAGAGNIELSLGSLGEVGTITVDQLQTTATVSVNANGGNIRRTNSDSLINAGGAAFETNGESGIGLDTEPIRLDVDNLEATTGSGGAFFELPNGGVTVGGDTDHLTGISATGGGEVYLSAVGDVTVAEEISTNVQDNQENAGNITLTTTGAIATTGALLSSTTTKGDSGNIALTADGAIATGTIISRSGFDRQGAEINGSKGSGGSITLESTNSTIDSSAGILDSRSSGGGAGQIKLTASDDILTGFVLASSQGPSANFSQGGIIEMTSSNGSIDTTAGDLSQEVSITDTSDLSSAKAILSLFNTTDLANLESYAVGGVGGNIMLSAYGDITTSYVNSFGKKGGGQISFSSVIGSINTANLFSISENNIAGNINLTTTDGAINTANLFSFSEQEAGGVVNITALGNVTLGGISAHGVSQGGAITINSDGNIDTTGGNLESFSDQGIGGDISLTALGSISTSNISTYGSIASGNVTLGSEANLINTGEINTIDTTTNTSGEITLNFYETTGDLQSSELIAVDDVQTITVTNHDGSVIVDSTAPTNSNESSSTNNESIEITFPPDEETTTETTPQSNPTTNSNPTSSESNPTTNSNSSPTDNNQSLTATDSTSTSTTQASNSPTSDSSNSSVNSQTSQQNATNETQASNTTSGMTTPSDENSPVGSADSNILNDNLVEYEIGQVTESAPITDSNTTINESNTVVENLTTDHGQTVVVHNNYIQENVQSQQTSSSQVTSSYVRDSRKISIYTSRVVQTITQSQPGQNLGTNLNQNQTEIPENKPINMNSDIGNSIENYSLNLNQVVVNEISSDRPTTTPTVPTENIPTTTPTVPTENIPTTLNVNPTIQVDSISSTPVSNPPIEINHGSNDQISGSANQISSQQSLNSAIDSMGTATIPSENISTSHSTIAPPIIPNSLNSLEENISNTQVPRIAVNPAIVNIISVNPASIDLLDNEEDDRAEEEDVVEEKDNSDSDEQNSAVDNPENNESESSIPQLNEVSAIAHAANLSANSRDLMNSTTVNDSQLNDSIKLEAEENNSPELSQANHQTFITEFEDVPFEPIASSPENISPVISENQPTENSTESSSSNPMTSSGTRVSFNQVIALEQRRKDEFEEYFDLNLENQLITAASAREILGTLERQTNQKSAVVYMTANPDQLESIIFTAKGEPIFYTVPAAKREVLLQTIQNFNLEITFPFKRKTTSYLPLAQQLYQWLIAPIESTLETEGIDTILFSMDAGLRSVPIAALHDGNQFLIEKYSLSFIPSVSLMDPRFFSLKESKVLAMGADTFPDMNSLPAVPVELEVITQHLPGKLFLNEEFTPENLRQVRQQDSYDIVHLATHADFIPGPLNNAFIYFWNEKINLNDLRDLGLQNPAAELLVLSACRTALGDRDAELGFAGLAIRSGVKSALASLWYVDDIGTLGFMTEFYQHLSSAPIKAEALRQAQIAMIHEEIKLEDHQLKLESDEKAWKDIVLPSTLNSQGNMTFSHPYYWAGFTMIGSPW